MSDLLVLEDAILATGAELPDELCPLYLVDAGRRAGGDAAVVAAHVLEVHREEWFGVGDLRFDPERVWKRLAKPKPRRALLWVEAASALRWHVQSLRQLVEAWGHRCAYTFSQGVVSEVRCSVGTFRVHMTHDEVEWVAPHVAWPFGDARTHTHAYPPHIDNLPPVTEWMRWKQRRGLVRPLTEARRSRKARDEARRSRRAEAEMQLGSAP